MEAIFLNAKDACVDCLTLNGSVFFLLYAAFVLYIGLAYEKKWVPTSGTSPQVLPDLAIFNIPAVSIQTTIFQLLSRILTPRNYIFCLRKITQNLRSMTGFARRSFIKNIFWLFALYYFIVSAPAVAMLPMNFNVKYNSQSIIALLLMMLTNAVGDFISIQITIHNIRKVFKYHQLHLRKDAGNASFFSSLKTEFFLYATTIFDMVLALVVLMGVLVLTSVYFGVSIGEYQFDLTNEFLEGAKRRIISFWSTAFEPYWFRESFYDGAGDGLPMLFIYSVTSFVPTFIILAFSLFWTLAMPLRIIYLSEINKYLKIVLSELVVFLICSASLAGYNSIANSSI